MRREVKFKPGYNHLDHSDPKKRSHHGMEIEMAVLGEMGAVELRISTMWTPLSENSWERFHNCRPETRDGFTGYVHTPSGAGVGFHGCRPWYDEMMESTQCSYIPDGNPCCYGDVGYVMSDDLTRLLISKGEDPVWERLEQLYGGMVVDIEKYDNEKRSERA